ncbi:hypothetical protein XELAEV_18014038mg [Xenopus laevis]|uniref:Uncharacterized protein n=1 Tax=Xenopus laevis TaxID=8355 RepID=A0A974I055_XENLA|nr:hypothetical protein XELAEV_18014038mg [Xenopus laevis]
MKIQDPLSRKPQDNKSYPCTMESRFACSCPIKVRYLGLLALLYYRNIMTCIGRCTRPSHCLMGLLMLQPVGPSKSMFSFKHNNRNHNFKLTFSMLYKG